MPQPVLVTIEMRFLTSEDPRAIADRVRESAAMIVGREALEEFRVRTMPLASPKKPPSPNKTDRREFP
jgi:hypothetical protein